MLSAPKSSRELHDVMFFCKASPSEESCSCMNRSFHILVRFSMLVGEKVKNVIFRWWWAQKNLRKVEDKRGFYSLYFKIIVF